MIRPSPLLELRHIREARMREIRQEALSLVSLQQSGRGTLRHEQEKMLAVWPYPSSAAANDFLGRRKNSLASVSIDSHGIDSQWPPISRS